MSTGGVQIVAGFPLALDRHYEPTTHVWVQTISAERVRIGMDALGVETSGTLAQLVVVPAGTFVRRGQSYGSLEAAKFVGPLTTPVTGTVLTVNAAVLEDAGVIERDPYGQGWLVELEPLDLERELAELVTGDQAKERFAARVAEYRAAGVLAQ